MQKKNKLLILSIIFIILNFSSNILNYISNIVISWKLLWDDYWKIMAIFSLIVILAIPTQIIQFNISNKTALDKDYELDNDLKFYSTVWFFYSLILIFLYIPIKNIINIWLIDYILVVSQTFLVFELTIFRWNLQWSKKFNVLWLSYFIEVLIKFLLIIISLFIFSKWISFILIAINLSILTAIFYTKWNITKFETKVIRQKTKYINIKEIFSNETIKQYIKEIRNLLWLFIWISWMIMLINIDMITVHYFIPTKASIYAVYTKLWQMIYMWWNIIIQLSIPIILWIYSEKKSTRKNFLKWFFIILFCWLIWISIFNFYWYEIINILFKIKITSVNELTIISSSYLLLVLWYYINNYLLSLKQYYCNYSILIWILFYILSISIINKNLYWFVISFLWTSLIYFLTSIFFILYFKLKIINWNKT